MVTFDLATTGATFVVLLAIVLGGTLTSPMATSTITIVGVGLVVFGLISLYIGMKHGEYRAAR